MSYTPDEPPTSGCLYAIIVSILAGCAVYLALWTTGVLP